MINKKTMNELMLQGNDTQTMSSREIAEITGKRHDHILRDCDVLNENYIQLSLPKIGEGWYQHSKTGTQQHREFLLTKIQTFDLMTGYSIELRIKVNRRWEELEKQQQMLDFNDPNTVLKLAQNWKNEQDKRLQAEKQLELQKPNVIFSNAITASHTTILVGELAKLLKQNGCDTSQNRLFEWLRDNGYLIKYGRSDYNMPTQKSMDLGLFEIKETPIHRSNGSITISKTPKVTGEGQKYFINLFLNENN